MRALVIGADGFVGRWLVKHLAEAGDEVLAIVGQDSTIPLAVACHQVDVRDQDSVASLISKANPGALYYLAGVSEPNAREDIRRAVGVAVIGLLNVMTACAELGTRPRLLIVGSAHMYKSAQSEPIREESPIGGPSVYGATKAAAEVAAFAIAEQLGVDVIAVRPFNHVGPGQSPAFVVPALARQVASIAAGLSPAVIHAGSLDSERDFTDVRDVVRAYRLLVELGEPQTAYNVASGRAVSIRSVLDHLLRLGDMEVLVESDSSLLRPNEPLRSVGDASRLQRRTGWQREIDLVQSLREVLVEAQEDIAASVSRDAK